MIDVYPLEQGRIYMRTFINKPALIHPTSLKTMSSYQVYIENIRGSHGKKRMEFEDTSWEKKHRD